MGARQKEQGFYGRAAWKRLRVMALNRDHWLCQECLRQGRLRQAREVHHLKPLEDYPELGLVLSNLESLCHDCHEDTKSREGRKETPAPQGVRIIKA